MADPTRDAVSRRTVLKGMAGTAGLVASPRSSPRAARRQPRRGERRHRPPRRGASAPAATARRQPPTGSLSFGSNYSDAVPKEAMQADRRRVHRGDRHHGHGQHGRPQHVPGPDQLRTSRARRTTSSPGSRASACGSSPTRAWHRRSTTCGRRSAATTPRRSRSVDRQRRQAVLHPDLLLPVGRLLPQERLRRRRATRSRRRATSSSPGHKMQADGLIPIAFGDKDGWPAHGHVRHHQPPAQRLRLPRRPDGRRRRSGPTPRSRPSSRSGRSSSPSTRKAPPAGPGRTPRQALVQKKSGMYLLGHVRLRAVRCDRRPGRPRRPRLLPVPEPGHRVRRREGARRADRRLQITAKSPKLADDLDAAKAYLEYWSKGSTQLIMFTNQPGLIPTAKDADTSTYSDLQKKAGRDRRRGPADHPVPRPRHPLRLRRRRTACRASSRLPAEPDQDLAAFQKTIQDFWDTLPPLV